MNYAGVTIDFYDDKGATLKAKFPMVDQLPDVIKTAEVMPKDQLPNEAFALVALDNGQVIRKLACYDPGTTAMSVIYLMQHGDKLPDEAIKMAAFNLVDRCQEFGMVPPDALQKAAGLRRLQRLGQATMKKYQAEFGKVPFLPVKNWTPGKGLDEATMRAGEKLERRADKVGGLKNYVEKHLGIDTSKTDRTALITAKPTKYTEMKSGASAVDTTGKKASAQVKVAKPMNDQDYAVVTPEGRFYPIDTYDRVKLATSYWQDNQKLMEPEVRHQFAVKLAAKAKQLGFMVDDQIKEAGATTWAQPGDIKQALEMRKVAARGQEEVNPFLDSLFEKRASVGPEVFARCIQRFDIEAGLDRYWGVELPDPWASTYGLDKTADEILWEDGVNRVSRGALENLAQNRLSTVQKTFTNLFANEFREDPVGIFESMPLTQKKILARLADNTAFDGSSEFDSAEPNPGEHKQG